MIVGRLHFTHLADDDAWQLMRDLDVWHGVYQTVPPPCEHGFETRRCDACGSPIEVAGLVECRHFLEALDDLPPGVVAVARPAPAGTGVRIERLADGVPPWSFDPWGPTGRGCR